MPNGTLSNDALLLARWKDARDPDAFAELVARYSGLVFHTCKRVLRDATRAQDVTQECFLLLAQAAAPIRRSLPGWLHAVAVSRSLDCLKSERRRSARESRYASALPHAVEPVWDDVQSYVDEAIAALPDRFRAAVICRYLEGKTLDQTSRSLGIANSTAQARLEKAVRLIRRRLGQRGLAVPAAAVATALGTLSSEQAPAAVVAALGKLALSGATISLASAAGAGTGLWGGLAVMKKATVISFVVLVIVGGGYLAFRETRPRPATIVPETATATLPAGDSGSPDLFAKTSIPAIPKDAEAPAAVIAEPTPTDNPPPNPQAGKTGVAGHVYNDHGPITGASVQVIPQVNALRGPLPTYHATTDADGNYRIEGMGLSGKAIVSASASGHVDELRQTVLRSGEVRDGVDFNLFPGLTFEGQVLSSSNRPIADAMVLPITNAPFWHGSFGEQGQYVVFTDENGLFRLGIRYDTTSDLQIIARGYTSVFLDVPLKEGAVVPFHLQPAASVRGTLTWTDGSPATGCTVSVRPMAELDRGDSGRPSQLLGVVAEAVAGPDGRFEIAGMAPGVPYVGGISTPDGKGLKGVARIEGTFAPGSVNDMSRVLPQPIRVTGIVYIEGTHRPLPGARVEAVREGPDRASAVDWHAEKGEYNLAVYEPGAYVIGADYKFPYELPGATSAYQKRVELKPGENLRLDLEVPAPFIVPVRAVDTDGKPIPTAQFHLTHLRQNEDSCTIVPADINGRTTWYCEAGHEVWITAHADRHVGASTKHFTSKGGVELPEQTIVLHRAASIRANIIPAERVAHGILLRVTYPDGVTENMNHTLYGSGEYIVRDAVRAGRMSVIAVENVADSLCASQSVEGSARPGETLDVGDLIVE